MYGKVYVLDMGGQIIETREVQVLTGEMEISLGHLAAGVYSVEFLPEENKERRIWTKKIVVVE